MPSVEGPMLEDADLHDVGPQLGVWYPDPEVDPEVKGNRHFVPNLHLIRPLLHLYRR
jgi:hypothetical protein